MKLQEINCQTGEVTQRELTPEELAQMQEWENQPLPVPSEITARQLRMALIMNGVDFQDIHDVLEQLPEPQKSLAKINWEYAGTFERDNGMMQEMIPLLGFSEEQINEIFTEGNKL